MKKKLTKKQIASIIVFWGIVVLFLAGLFVLAFSRQIFGNEVGDALLGPDVENGFILVGNFFVSKAGALLLSVITIFVCVILYFILVYIIKRFLRKTPRKKTIASLLSSLVKYLVVVLAICIVLGCWGVNVAGIFAGVGVLALIIGLGCKTLVNDIVSGFFIVVDSYFEVGERVIIDGFTGTIDSVGLRTTKIISWDGNIKCINNSFISTVVNLSRLNSVAIVYISLSLNEDIRRAEAVIYKNLERIKQQVPQITNGPTYNGVDAINNNGLSLMFIADCNEFDRFAVQRGMLRELAIIFKENNLLIPYQQIVVNPQDPTDRPKATKEDIEDSYKLRHPNN